MDFILFFFKKREKKETSFGRRVIKMQHVRGYTFTVKLMVMS